MKNDKKMQLKTISHITMSALLVTTLLNQTFYGYNNDNPNTHVAFAQQQTPLSSVPQLPSMLGVVLTYIGDNIAYRHGLHFC